MPAHMSASSSAPNGTGSRFTPTSAGRPRQGLVARPRRALVEQVGRQIAVLPQKREHPLLVARRQLLIERAAIDRLAEQLRDFAARIVDGLAHLDRLAAIRGRIEQQRAAAGIDLDLERDAQLPAIAEKGLMMAGHARRAGIPVEVLIEFADLARAVGQLDLGAPADRPVAAADAIAGLEHRAVVAGLAELIGGRQSGDAGAENDHLGAVAGARFERQRFGERRRAEEAHRLHREVGRAISAGGATCRRKSRRVPLIPASVRGRLARWTLFDLHDHLDFDRGVAGKACHADGGAGMLADRFAEHLDHQVGKPVHHLRLVAEALGRVDHAENLDDPLDAIEAAERGPHFPSMMIPVCRAAL